MSGGASFGKEQFSRGIVNTPAADRTSCSPSAEKSLSPRPECKPKVLAWAMPTPQTCYLQAQHGTGVSRAAPVGCSCRTLRGRTSITSPLVSDEGKRRSRSPSHSRCNAALSSAYGGAAPLQPAVSQHGACTPWDPGETMFMVQPAAPSSLPRLWAKNREPSKRHPSKQGP